MPYPHEHSARLQEPGKFDPKTFKRTKGGTIYGSIKVPATIGIIWGKLKGKTKPDDPPLPQALRFPIKKWTATEAKKWLKDNKVKFIKFEPATEKKDYEGENIMKDSKANEIPDVERRILPVEDIELRLDDSDKPRLVGYVAKYGIFADLGWFIERIKAGAFDDILKDKDSDVRCLKNHDPNLILGRTKNNTLQLESNTVGLKFDDDIPDTTTGKDTLEEVRRGDISGCSFSFTVAEDDWKYFDDDRPSERTIVKIGRLFDVGPVTYPAYSDTIVAARSLDNFRKSTEQPKLEDKETTKPKKEIERGYEKAGRIINRIKSAEV